MSGPSWAGFLTGNAWVDLVISLAGLATAVVVVWRKVVVPLGQLVQTIVHAHDTFERVAPVLIRIGEEFHGNGGGSLMDVLARIETNLTARGDKLDELHDYSHAWRHALSGDLTKLVLADRVINRKLDELAAAVAGP